MTRPDQKLSTLRGESMVHTLVDSSGTELPDTQKPMTGERLIPVAGLVTGRGSDWSNGNANGLTPEFASNRRNPFSAIRTTASAVANSQPVGQAKMELRRMRVARPEKPVTPTPAPAVGAVAATTAGTAAAPAVGPTPSVAEPIPAPAAGATPAPAAATTSGSAATTTPSSWPLIAAPVRWKILDVKEMDAGDVPVVPIHECHVRWQNPHDTAMGAKAGDPAASRVTNSNFITNEESVGNTIDNFDNPFKTNTKLWLTGGTDLRYAGLLPWDFPTPKPMASQLGLRHPDTIVTILLPTENLAEVRGSQSGQNADVPAHGLMQRDQKVPVERVFTLAGEVYKCLTESRPGLDKGYMLFELVDGSRLIVDWLSGEGMRKDSPLAVEDIFGLENVDIRTWQSHKYEPTPARSASSPEVNNPQEITNWKESKGWGVGAEIELAQRREPLAEVSDKDLKDQREKELAEKRRKFMSAQFKMPPAHGTSPGAGAKGTFHSLGKPEPKPDRSASMTRQLPTAASSSTSTAIAPRGQTSESALPPGTLTTSGRASAAVPGGRMAGPSPSPAPSSVTKRDGAAQPPAGPPFKKPSASSATNIRPPGTPAALATPQIPAQAPPASQSSTPVRHHSPDRKRKDVD